MKKRRDGEWRREGMGSGEEKDWGVGREELGYEEEKDWRVKKRRDGECIGGEKGWVV